MIFRVLLISAGFVFVYSLTVLHLSDFHLDVHYSIYGDNQKMCHKMNGTAETLLGSFGDYMCDSPKDLVSFTLDQAKRLFPNPDVVLWTGDNVPHIDSYDWNYVNNVVNITTNLLLSHFPNVGHILPTFGNHDYAPANAFSDSSKFYETTWKLWEKLIKEDNKERFLRGGYYKYRLPNATVLVLNTNLYYNANKAYEKFTDKEDPAGQFAFMENELQSASECPERTTENCTSIVHIVAHIGPGVFERTPNFTWFRDHYNEKFLNISVKYANTIGWMLFGHHHSDTFHIIRNATGTPVQFTLMSPAVTPWFSSLEGAGANNPSFRVYDVDDMNRIIDIRTFYVNLDELNQQRSTNFTKEYSFKDAYNIDDYINLKAMAKLAARLQEDDNLFEKYIMYNSVLWKPQIPEGKFRGAQLCSINHADYPRYISCLAAYNSTADCSTLSALLLSMFCFYVTYINVTLHI